MISSRDSVLELDYTYEILDRVRSLSVQHEHLLAQFWNSEHGRFALEDVSETSDHVTSSCTCVLSFIDISLTLPSFLDTDARASFANWLLTVEWETAGLGLLNVYTTPVALATLLAVAPVHVAENRSQEAIRALVNASLDIDPEGPLCFGDYPPSAFLTY